MKISLILFFIAIIQMQTTLGQNCRYNIGDFYDLKKSGANIREQPSINSKIIFTINYKSRNKIAFEILDNYSQNNFIKVRILIETSKSVPELAKFDSLIAWIHTSLIEYQYLFGYGFGFSSDYYDEGIEEQRLLKNSNECSYLPDLHSFYYAERGIIKYQSKDYYGAIADLSESLKISGTSDFIVRIYAFRASSKENLEDYYGAIDDYNLAINTCESTKNTNFACDICGKHNDGWSNKLGTSRICKEALLVNRALCKIQLKNYNSALTDLNTVIFLNADWGHAYYIRGQLKDILNDTSGCCKDLSKAGELGIKAAYEEIKNRCNN